MCASSSQGCLSRSHAASTTGTTVWGRLGLLQQQEQAAAGVTAGASWVHAAVGSAAGKQACPSRRCPPHSLEHRHEDAAGQIVGRHTQLLAAAHCEQEGTVRQGTVTQAAQLRDKSELLQALPAHLHIRCCLISV